MNPPSLCYCDAINQVACSFGEYIENVSITGTPLDNTSYCDSSNATSNYTFYPPGPTTTANLARNTNYDINVTANFDAIISVWIDLNADGIYDASEWMQVCTHLAPSSAVMIVMAMMHAATTLAAHGRTRTAANVAAALKVARELGPRATVVTVLCDSGDRYRSRLYDGEWLRGKGLLQPVRAA